MYLVSNILNLTAFIIMQASVAWWFCLSEFQILREKSNYEQPELFVCLLLTVIVV